MTTAGLRPLPVREDAAIALLYHFPDDVEGPVFDSPYAALGATLPIGYSDGSLDLGREVAHYLVQLLADHTVPTRSRGLGHIADRMDRPVNLVELLAHISRAAGLVVANPSMYTATFTERGWAWAQWLRDEADARANNHGVFDYRSRLLTRS